MKRCHTCEGHGQPRALFATLQRAPRYAPWRHGLGTRAAQRWQPACERRQPGQLSVQRRQGFLPGKRALAPAAGASLHSASAASRR